MNKESKIYVSGHEGMVGSAILRRLQNDGYSNIITRSFKQLDLTKQNDVETFFSSEKPDVVFLVAANVGGVKDNREYPAEHLIDNSLIAINVIRNAYLNGCKQLLFISSNCIYPTNAELPLKETCLLQGPLDSDWEGYGISKIVGLKLCEYYSKQYGMEYFSVVPCNLYGINDCYDPQKSRVTASLIRRFHEAKINNVESIEIWGDGSALREFLYSDDLAEACIYLIDHHGNHNIINLSPGTEVSIKELAILIKEIVGYEGTLVFNADKPGGIYRKNMSIEVLNKLNWHAGTSLKDGIIKSYEHYKSKYDLR